MGSYEVEEWKESDGNDTNEDRRWLYLGEQDSGTAPQGSIKVKNEHHQLGYVLHLGQV